eukprot:6817905-Pyramimonas_sp.AAC.1
MSRPQARSLTVRYYNVTPTARYYTVTPAGAVAHGVLLKRHARRRGRSRCVTIISRPQAQSLTVRYYNVTPAGAVAHGVLL